MEALSNAQTHALLETMASATTVALVLIRLRLRRACALTPALYIVATMATAHNTTSRTHGVAVPATTIRPPTMASVTTVALVRSTQPALGAPIATTAAHARLLHPHQTARWAPTVPTAGRAWCTRRLRHLLHRHLHCHHRHLRRRGLRRYRRPRLAHLRAHLHHHLRGAPGQYSAAPIRASMPTTGPVKMVARARSHRSARRLASTPRMATATMADPVVPIGMAIRTRTAASAPTARTAALESYARTRAAIASPHLPRMVRATMAGPVPSGRTAASAPTARTAALEGARLAPTAPTVTLVFCTRRRPRHRRRPRRRPRPRRHNDHLRHLQHGRHHRHHRHHHLRWYSHRRPGLLR